MNTPQTRLIRPSRHTSLRSLRTLAALAVMGLGASIATAGPQCDVPKAQWMKESDFKAKLEQQGYRITTFKVSKGQCYEIYGHDKAGKKVEIYFNPQTGAVLEQKAS